MREMRFLNLPLRRNPNSVYHFHMIDVQSYEPHGCSVKTIYVRKALID